MSNSCQGCGATYQSLNPNSPGYVRKEKINDAIYCERCFKIIHYGKSLVTSQPTDIDKIINVVNGDIIHSLFLVDFLTLNEDIISVFNKIKYPKTLIISKTDLYRSFIKPNKIKEYITNYYHVKENIVFISSKQHQTDDLLAYLRHNKIEKAYLLGFVNAGKSSFINEILKINNQKINDLTTSHIPHTTMNFINIKINDNLLLIDSPGFSYTDFLNNNLEILKKINLTKKIKPATYQMKSSESLVIENIILITFHQKSGATIYISNDFVIKKDYKINRSHIKYHIPTNSDLVIKGIGFINIKNECEIEIDIEDEKLIEIRPSVFGGEINE